MAFEIEKQLVQEKVMPQLNQFVADLRAADYFNPRNQLSLKKQKFINAARALHEREEIDMKEEASMSLAFNMFETELQKDAVFKTLLIQDKKTDYQEDQLIKFLYLTTQALAERKISKIISKEYKADPQQNTKMRQMLAAQQLMLVQGEGDEYDKMVSIEDLQDELRNGRARNYILYSPFATRKKYLNTTTSGMLRMMQYNQVQKYKYALEESGYKVGNIAQSGNRFTINALSNQGRKVQLTITISELATMKTRTRITGALAGQQAVIVTNVQEMKQVINSAKIKYTPGQAVGNAVRTQVNAKTNYEAKVDGKQAKDVITKITLFPQIFKKAHLKPQTKSAKISKTQLKTAATKAVNQEKGEDKKDSIQAKKQAYAQQQQRQKQLKQHREKQELQGRRNQAARQQSRKPKKSPMGKALGIVNVSTFASILDPGFLDIINPFFG